MKYSAASVQLLPPPAESPDISAMSFLLGNFVNYIHIVYPQNPSAGRFSEDVKFCIGCYIVFLFSALDAL
jgi:hypothetical protein